MLADDNKAEIMLSDIMRSRKFMGNNLKFQIPAGAIINGITLMLEGQSDMYQNIDEVEILLLDKAGEPKGQNKQNSAKLQKAWEPVQMVVTTAGCMVLLWTPGEQIGRRRK